MTDQSPSPSSLRAFWRALCARLSRELDTTSMRPIGDIANWEPDAAAGEPAPVPLPQAAPRRAKPASRAPARTPVTDPAAR